MKKIIFTLLLFPASFIIASAQAPQKLWDSFFDGTLNGKDESNSVATDNAGNVYITGKCFNTLSIGNFTTVKYDINGIEQWSDNFSGTQSWSFNEGKKIVTDKDQNLYAIGTVALNDGDVAIVKYNANGKIWSQSYEPYWFGSAEDRGIDICVDTSNNFYAVGEVVSLSGNLLDSYFMKCDSAGLVTFSEDFTSASGDDFPAGVAVTPAGNFFGLSNSFNFFGSQTYDIFTINYLNNGNQNWISRFNGTGNGIDYGTFIKADPAGNQYVCGTTASTVNNDMVVMKQNIYGTRLWTNTYDGTASGNDTAVSTTWLPNGFVVVTGRSKELLNGSTMDAMVTMVTDSGTVVWTNIFYGTDSLGAIPTQMVTDAQGNIYVCGTELLNGVTRNGCILKYDMSGNLLWNISYDAGLNLDDKFNSIILDFNNDILVTGQSYTTALNSRYVTVKYQNAPTGISEISSHISFRIYPNPGQSIINISSESFSSGNSIVNFYDLQGRKIMSKAISLNSPGNKITLDVSSIPAGIYNVEVGNNSEYHSKPLIIQK